MGSPFPGMDPYIEANHLWEDFHTNLIGEIYRALADVVPDRYVVRAGERSYVALAYTDDDEDRSSFLPDVTVATSRWPSKRRRRSKGLTGPPALQHDPGSLVMEALVEVEYRETFLEIRQVTPEHKLITGIEVLSPSNKRPGTKGWRLYQRKRLAYLSGSANLVEIDLLRRGRRMPMVSPWPDAPYYVLVCQKKQAPRRSVWPAHFTEPLPPTPIPLAPPDPDLSLVLQPLIDAVYTRSRYARDIDYARPLNPALNPKESAWLAKRLRQRQSPGG